MVEMWGRRVEGWGVRVSETNHFETRDISIETQLTDLTFKFGAWRSVARFERPLNHATRKVESVSAKKVRFKLAAELQQSVANTGKTMIGGCCHGYLISRWKAALLARHANLRRRSTVLGMYSDRCPLFFARCLTSSVFRLLFCILWLVSTVLCVLCFVSSAWCSLICCHCFLSSVLSPLFYVLCFMSSVLCSLFYVLCFIFTVSCPLFCFMSSVLYPLFYIHCFKFTVLCPLFYIHCFMFSVLFYVFCFVSSVLYSLF